METNGSYYFAYGSNLNLRDLEAWCRRQGCRQILDARTAEKAFLPDHALAFTRYAATRSGGVLDVVRNRGCGVFGVLFRVTEADLEILDRKEGVTCGAYRRITVDVQRASGEPVSCVTYEVVRKEPFVQPDPGYVRIVEEGFRRFRLPMEQLDRAVRGIQARLPLFVYGTLRRGFSRGSVMQETGAEFMGTATIRAALYDTGCGYPCVVPGDGCTWGELYVLPDAAAVERLDATEGCTVSSEPGLFRRRLMQTDPFGEGGRRLPAWVYCADEARGTGYPKDTWERETSPGDFCSVWLTALLRDVQRNTCTGFLPFTPSSWYAMDVTVTQDTEQPPAPDTLYGKQCVRLRDARPVVWLFHVLRFVLKEAMDQDSSGFFRYSLGRLGDRCVSVAQDPGQDIRVELIAEAERCIREYITECEQKEHSGTEGK